MRPSHLLPYMTRCDAPKSAMSRSDRERIDARLVQLALEEVAPLNNYEAADRIGVSEGTIRRWRDGEIATPLRSATRRAISRFLDEQAAQIPWEELQAAVGALSRPIQRAEEEAAKLQRMVGQRIRDAREALGLTERDLAAAVLNETREAQIRAWEDGEFIPGVGMLIQLAEALEVSTDYLLGLSPYFTGNALTYEDETALGEYRLIEKYTPRLEERMRFYALQRAAMGSRKGADQRAREAIDRYIPLQ
jgi:transcriptional regulator with XRE-family HTH domain